MSAVNVADQNFNTDGEELENYQSGAAGMPEKGRRDQYTICIRYRWQYSEAETQK